MRLSFKKFGSPAIGPKRGSKKIGDSWPFQKPRRTRHPGRVSSHPKTVNCVSEAFSHVWAMMRVLQNSMLPAGFEPASEARKAPILDRTRLRERKAGLVPGPINAFGNAPHRRCKTGNYLKATTFGGGEMRREKPTITELSFFFCGFLVI